MSKHTCPSCHGQRLNDKVLSCKINELNIAEFTNLQIDDALAFLKKIDSDKARVIIEPLKQQLEALSYIGLNYLTLGRETTTLSGGESQRIKLIRHLNSPLTDLVYIIDEPSVGLHPEDIQRINDIIVFSEIKEIRFLSLNMIQMSLKLLIILLISVLLQENMVEKLHLKVHTRNYYIPKQVQVAH